MTPAARIGPERAPSRWRALQLAILAATPLALAGIWVALLRAKGPYWLGTNLDPEYQYLLNGLGLCYGQVPGHVDHPGTPVQILVAAILLVTHLLTGDGPLASDVVRRPEHYLLAANGVLLFLFAGALAAAGLAARRATGSLLAGLAAELLPGLTSVVALNAIGVRPDSLLATLAALLAFQVLRELAPDRRPGRIPVAVPFGVLTGLAVASKVSAAPLLVLPALLLRGFRSRILYAGVTAATMVVTTFPAWPAMGKFFRFIGRIATHSGQYGSGRESVLDVHEYLHGLRNLAGDGAGHPTVAVAVIAFGALAALLLTLRAGRDRDGPAMASRDALAASVATQVVTYLLVARHADAHYLVPGLVLCGLTAALAVHALRILAPRRPVLRGLLAAGLLALCGQRLVRDLQDARRGLETERDAQLSVVATLAERFPGARVLHFYRSSSPAYALHFGDTFARSRFSRQIQDLYPAHLYYDLWSERLEAYRPDPAHPTASPFRREELTTDVLCGVGDEAALVAQGSPLQGLPSTVTSTATLRGRMEPVYSTAVEGLYRPRGCSEADAAPR